MSNSFKIHILGSSAAIPTSLRHTSAQVVQYHNKYMLVDCAEGTQIQMRRLRLPMMKINHIFISHLHGDHYLGLPGLIFTMHLLGRKRKLHVYAPEGLKEIIELQYRISKLVPGFSIEYHQIDKGQQLLYEDNDLRVESIEMLHSISTFGFLFTERPGLRNIKKSAIAEYDIPVDKMQSLKNGKDLQLPDGTIIANKLLTTPPPPPRVYAFCSDTGFTHQYIDQIKDADLLYHEATFLHDKVDIAREKTHCTALQAATIAKDASAKKLMLGHYSARYDELSEFLDEARAVFENTILAEEGNIIEISPIRNNGSD